MELSDQTAQNPRARLVDGMPEMDVDCRRWKFEGPISMMLLARWG